MMYFIHFILANMLRVHQGRKNQMAVAYSKNGPRNTKQETTTLETYGNLTSRKTETTMARGCYGTSKQLKVKNWKEIAKDRRTWTDLAKKAKNHKEFYCQMKMMMMTFRVILVLLQDYKGTNVESYGRHPIKIENYYNFS